MADNYLITGYWGEPHVTAENDRGINAAMFGTGRFVLPVGEQLKAELISTNTVRLYDGKLMDNGAAAGIPVGEYVDLPIAYAGQGMKRNDLIVFQYSKDSSTLIESGVFTVVRGTETSGTASDPALTQADLLSGEAVFDQMALWRVPVSGVTISAPVKLFSVSQDIPTLKKWAEDSFAPAGHGLGGYGQILYKDSLSDLDSIKANGKYSIWSNAFLGIDEFYFKQAILEVSMFNDIHGYQTLTPIGANSNLVRHCVDGVWQPWEWENPPMLAGVEYRTTKRWKDKVVYQQVLAAGALPASGSVHLNIPTNGTLDYILSAKGSTADKRVFPTTKIAGVMTIDLETSPSGVDVYVSHDVLAGTLFYITAEYTLM